jgi:hypothetical protein
MARQHFRHCALLLSLIFFIGSTSPLRGSDALRQGLSELAKDVKRLMERRGEGALAVGQFTGPASFPATAGPGIAQLLTEELQKLGVAVRPRAQLGVKGEYLAKQIPAVDGQNIKQLAVLVKARLEDQLGNTVTEIQLERTIPSDEAVLQVMGTSVQLNTADPATERIKKILASYVRPQTGISGSRISAAPGSRFAIELLVNGQPRGPREDNGLAFVQIDRGERYAVRLINDSDREMAVRLTIDGLSMYAFSELRHTDGPKLGEPLYNYVILRPQSSALIEGWHRTNDRSDSFLVTEYAKSAAANLNQRAGIGTITATFSESHAGNTSPITAGRGLGGNATGFGPSVESKFVAVDRVVGPVLAAVSVRYTR